MANKKSGIAQEEFYKEMDMIQACINRMQHNSFIVKGWLLTILGVIFSFTFGTDDLLSLILILLIPILCFWYVDAFFLWTERLYRKKYEWIILTRPEGNRTYMYDLNPHNQEMWIKGIRKPGIIKAMFSKTLLPFYVTPILLFLLLTGYTLYRR